MLLLCLTIAHLLHKYNLLFVRVAGVREHRTAADWAEEIKYLVDTGYPDKQKIILVQEMGDSKTEQQHLLLRQKQYFQEKRRFQDGLKHQFFCWYAHTEPGKRFFQIFICGKKENLLESWNNIDRRVIFRILSAQWYLK